MNRNTQSITAKDYGSVVTIIPGRGLAGAEVRATHVDEETSTLAISAGELEEVVSRLVDRLQTVANDNPVPEDTAPPDSYRVPLADTIRSQRRRVQASVGRLQRLLDGLEL